MGEGLAFSFMLAFMARGRGRYQLLLPKTCSAQASPSRVADSLFLWVLMESTLRPRQSDPVFAAWDARAG